MPHAAIPFRPHHRFAVPLPRSRRGGFSFTARQLLFPMRRMRAAAKYRRSEPIGAPMPHAALWVVQLPLSVKCFGGLPFQCRTRLCGWCSRLLVSRRFVLLPVSMPHAALWVVQLVFEKVAIPSDMVSMPHAALWMVQRVSVVINRVSIRCFNAARGFVGGATKLPPASAGETRFQCRTRLCGWCNRIARSPCPPRGKKPFWKVSENLSVLTENM